MILIYSVMANKNIGRARILQELKNLKKEELDYLHAEPLETDLYTWHFTFRGPENTDFHEGLYHGQIILPFEYPFKPPDIIFSNKNGRFEVNTKICLTITQYHTEEWNSAWTIRTMLEAVISLFNERVMGHGYLESTSQVRRYFATSSHNYTCEKCGKIGQILKPRSPMVIKKEEERMEDFPSEANTKMAYKELIKNEVIRGASNPRKEETSRGKKRRGEEKRSGGNKEGRNREERNKERESKKRKVREGEFISASEYFYQTLKAGNEEYLSVLKSKKLVTE